MSEEALRGKRPVVVWAILVFYVLSGGWSLQSVPSAGDANAYFERITPTHYVLAQIQSLACLGAAIALFMMRKIALLLFAACLWLGLLTTLGTVYSQGLSAIVRGATGLSLMLNWGVLLAALIYTLNLHKLGKLR